MPERKHVALAAPPLALYVHMPWCVKKCPYCDFNSHGLGQNPPRYAEYIDDLLADLDGDRADFASALAGRPIQSIFFGGGTPSLFAPELIDRLLEGVRARLPVAVEAEITLETNPGTVEHGRFDGYLAAGVNRISFGVQSFDDDKLRRLGRIHSAAEATRAVKSAQDEGYANINLDLMYALPTQTLDGALEDVRQAIALAPRHISHYQLTLEPDTVFARHPPPLPNDDQAWAMQEACQDSLAAAGYGQYEISAYALPGYRCVHNQNYWRFGDYLGIGAGAHGKLSDPERGVIRRRWKDRNPRSYMAAASHATRVAGDQVIAASELPFEYMLNALRLVDGVAAGEFAERTGLDLACIAPALAQARQRGWLEGDIRQLRTTALGQRFLNDVIVSFMS